MIRHRERGGFRAQTHFPTEAGCREGASPIHRRGVRSRVIRGSERARRASPRMVDADELPIAMGVALGVLFLGLIASIAYWLRLCRLEKSLESSRRQADRTRVLQAANIVHEVRYPACFITFDKLRAIGRLERCEVLRDAGLLTTFDSFPALTQAAERIPTVFISHQWLATEEPDPRNAHYDAIVRACNWLCLSHNLPEETLHCWVDFCSIPYAARRRSFHPAVYRPLGG